MPTKRLFACLALAVGIGFPSFVSATSLRQASMPALTKPMLALINRDREAAGVSPLRLGGRLARVAVAHSLDMADHDYFSHLTLRGTSPFQRMSRAGIRYRLAGENVGLDSGLSPMKMLRRLEAAMLHSPAHRANLLRPTFTRVGIGIAMIGNQLYITEDFKH